MPNSLSGNPELAIWELLRGPNGSQYKDEAQRSFLQLFPKGHHTSLLGYVREWRKPWIRQKWLERWDCTGLVHPHQRGWQLLLEYGQDYVPCVHTSLPIQSTPNECYANAYVFMQAMKQFNPGMGVSYVEGVIFGPLVRPMLHGWNTSGNDGAIAYDPTLFTTCEWSRYLGIPFTAEEYESICGKKRVGPLFHKDHFARHEHGIRHVLSQRKKRSEEAGVA